MKTANPYVVLAEDDKDDRDFFCAGMRRVFPRIDILTFEGGDQLMQYLRKCSGSQLPACIILDYKMSPHNAPLILMAMAEDTPYTQIPKIIWSTSGRQKDKEECLLLGAVRYIVKPDTDAEFDSFLRSIGYLWGQPVSRQFNRNGTLKSSGLLAAYPVIKNL